MPPRQEAAARVTTGIAQWRGWDGTGQEWRARPPQGEAASAATAAPWPTALLRVG